ncbi:MAG: aldo/keto reductase [Mailhella sp.]|nr:aldo/keto reductase [Mailhella sp.]
MVGLGTYSLKGKICIESVYNALKNGYRLIDTAHAYGNEQEVGAAVRKAVADGIAAREEITVVTKLYPNQYGNPVQAIEEGLAKLDIGWCDIMLLHHPGSNDIEAYRAMEKYVDSGRIRALGLSCFYIEELTAFLSKVRIKPVLVQNEIHPYYQDRDVVQFIQKQGIAVQAWYPLGGRGHQKELFSDPVLTEIAVRHGKSVAQIMIKWNVQNGVIVIPGSSNPMHQAENMDIFDFELTPADMKAIGALERREKHDWY